VASTQRNAATMGTGERGVSGSPAAAGLPAVPVVEVHYGLQRGPPAS